MIASAVAAGAISSPRAWAQAGQSISRSTVYDVAIIGAGAAGIAAAHAFAGTGARVIVLEARGRPGGRIVTNSQALGMPFDVGASYIHNAPINPIMALAAQQGVTVSPAIANRWRCEPIAATSLDQSSIAMLRLTNG